MLSVFGAGFQRCHLEALADPLSQFLEFERLVENDAGLAVREPAHFATDRAKALDYHDDRLAEAIFLDRLNLHPAERDVMHFDRVIIVLDP